MLTKHTIWDCLDDCWNYIALDGDGTLWAYERKPTFHADANNEYGGRWEDRVGRPRVSLDALCVEWWWSTSWNSFAERPIEHYKKYIGKMCWLWDSNEPGARRALRILERAERHALCHRFYSSSTVAWNYCEPVSEKDMNTFTYGYVEDDDD